MFRGKESSNRIKISWLVQDLLNFGVLGSLRLWRGGRWVGGVWRHLCMWLPTYMHTHVHAHTHMYTCIEIANGCQHGGTHVSSPPATSMRAHCLSSGIWSATKITSIRRLKTFQAATLSAALQFISGYFSLGTDGMISAIRRSFQDHEGKLNERYLSNNWR